MVFYLLCTCAISLFTAHSTQNWESIEALWKWFILTIHQNLPLTDKSSVFRVSLINWITLQPCKYDWLPRQHIRMFFVSLFYSDVVRKCYISILFWGLLLHVIWYPVCRMTTQEENLFFFSLLPEIAPGLKRLYKWNKVSFISPPWDSSWAGGKNAHLGVFLTTIGARCWFVGVN